MLLPALTSVETALLAKPALRPLATPITIPLFLALVCILANFSGSFKTFCKSSTVILLTSSIPVSAIRSSANFKPASKE